MLPEKVNSGQIFLFQGACSSTSGPPDQSTSKYSCRNSRTSVGMMVSDGEFTNNVDVRPNSHSGMLHNFRRHQSHAARHKPDTNSSLAQLGLESHKNQNSIVPYAALSSGLNAGLKSERRSKHVDSARANYWTSTYQHTTMEFLFQCSLPMTDTEFPMSPRPLIGSELSLTCSHWSKSILRGYGKRRKVRNEKGACVGP